MHIWTAIEAIGLGVYIALMAAFMIYVHVVNYKRRTKMTAEERAKEDAQVEEDLYFL